MIHTQYGVQVQVIRVDLDRGVAVVHYVDDGEDGEPREVPLLSLRADGGIREVLASADGVDESQLIHSRSHRVGEPGAPPH